MPIEIRELVIKTEIVSLKNRNGLNVKEKDMLTLKNTIIEECKRIISDQTLKKKPYKR